MREVTFVVEDLEGALGNVAPPCHCNLFAGMGTLHCCQALLNRLLQSVLCQPILAALEGAQVDDLPNLEPIVLIQRAQVTVARSQRFQRRNVDTAHNCVFLAAQTFAHELPLARLMIILGEVQEWAPN